MPLKTNDTNFNPNAGFDQEAQWHSLLFSPMRKRQKIPGGSFSSVDLRFSATSPSKYHEVVTTSLNEFIAFELSLVQEVAYVYTAYRNGIFYVWIVLDQFEQEVRKRIYDREKAIIDEFSMFEFDFYIVARAGRDADELISESVKLAYERSRS